VIPHAPKQPSDLIDLLFEAVQEINQAPDENGQMQNVIEPDNESLYWRTLLINNPNFGGCVLEIKKWENLMRTAKDNMCEEVAAVLLRQGMAIAKGYKYAFAGKSSETLRDKHNAQSSLTHILQRNHVEKTVTVDEKVKGGLAKSLGLAKDDDYED
jgi:hypothetical protein